MLQNLIGGRGLGGFGLGGKLGLRSAAVGAKPGTTEFKKTMIIGGTSVTSITTSRVAGDFQQMTYYTVQAQEKATFGHGVPGDDVNQGFIYLQYQTTVPAAIDGPVRLLAEGAHGDSVPGFLVLEEHSTRLDGSLTTRGDQVPLPKWPRWASEDSRLTVRLNPSATATPTTADSTVLLPITVAQNTE